MTDTFNKQVVINLAARSSLVLYAWRQRGRAPVGYIKGMAVMYARVLQNLYAKDPAALEMAKPLGDPGRDALAWYGFGGVTERERLRSLFALLIGLGMRESSGNFCEGRDASAHNVSADTAEAGLFQMSWDIAPAAPMIGRLYQKYINLPLADCLADVFHEGVTVTDQQLYNYGSGPGANYQYNAKARPAFAVETAAIGLRNLRTHWGPINRHEVEFRAEAVELLRAIELNVPSLAPPVPQPAKPVYTSWFLWLWGLILKLFGRRT